MGSSHAVRSGLKLDLKLSMTALPLTTAPSVLRIESKTREKMPKGMLAGHVICATASPTDFHSCAASNDPDVAPMD